VKRYALDIATRQFQKQGEDIAGDAVRVVSTPDSTIISVSDGLGSGVKANVLATLTVEVACGLSRGDLSLQDIVETLIATLPVCKWRNIAYSTFSVARVYDSGRVTLAEYDCPPALLLADGIRPRFVETFECFVRDRRIRVAYFRMQPGDVLVQYTDGIVWAGVGQRLPMGWQEEGIFEFLSATAPALRGDCTAQATRLAEQALEYWEGSPGDDGTVVCARYRKARQAVLLTGPPASPERLPAMLQDFLGREGTRLVCGGTTAHLLARHLDVPLEVDDRFLDSDLPPGGKIQGVDLVTEGILTLTRAAEYLRRGIPDDRRDAATCLLDHLLEADGITFLVGTARNPAHQNTGLPESIFLRRLVAEELASRLCERGREVELVFY
jgi:hypothetical protein